jgi:hypothetical protein
MFTLDKQQLLNSFAVVVLLRTLQDGMTQAWPAAAVAQQVEQHLTQHPCDTVSQKQQQQQQHMPF